MQETRTPPLRGDQVRQITCAPRRDNYNVASITRRQRALEFLALFDFVICGAFIPWIASYKALLIALAAAGGLSAILDRAANTNVNLQRLVLFGYSVWVVFLGASSPLLVLLVWVVLSSYISDKLFGWP